MSKIEEAVLRRFSGAKRVLSSAVLALAGYMPLQLYIWFGPRNGNPIGLGLLAFAVLPFAGIGAVIGAIKMLVERLRASGD